MERGRVGGLFSFLCLRRWVGEWMGSVLLLLYLGVGVWVGG